MPAGSRALVVAIVIVAASCASPNRSVPQWDETRLVNGFSVQIVAREHDEARAHAAIDLAFAAAEEASARLLRGRVGGDVDILMHVPAHVWIEVSSETARALLEAQTIAERTGGAFDPTFPPLLTLWGLRGDHPPRAPRDFEIDMALQKVDWTDIEVKVDGLPSARRLTRRTELDLDRFARGAALDAAMERLRVLGVRAGCASTAHQHVAYGADAREPWRIPLRIRGAAPTAGEIPVAILKLREGAVAVASRGPIVFADDGTLIHDRIDPRTGRPANDSRWVAVVASRGSQAAGYADAVFAMGREGRGFVESEPSLRAAIVPEEGERWASPGLEVDWDAVTATPR